MGSRKSGIRWKQISSRAHHAYRPALRLLQPITGLFLYGFGASLMIRAAIGVAPWDVLSQGHRRTPLSFGLATNVIGALVLLLWWPLRQKPGVGTVLNVMLIGPSAQFGLCCHRPSAWAGSWRCSVQACCWSRWPPACIGARLGPGPRDGLMTGLHARTGWPIWKVRSLIEGSVLLLGWWLGGNVGLGTLAFALLIGPLCGVTLAGLGSAAPGRTRRCPAAAITLSCPECRPAATAPEFGAAAGAGVEAGSGARDSRSETRERQHACAERTRPAAALPGVRGSRRRGGGGR